MSLCFCVLSLEHTHKSKVVQRIKKGMNEIIIEEYTLSDLITAISFRLKCICLFVGCRAA